MEYLIPQAWFDDLHGGYLFGIFLVALGVLTRAADRVVDDASALAARLGVAPVLIGATVVWWLVTSPLSGLNLAAIVGIARWVLPGVSGSLALL
ncbi:MAG: hypothetical protein AAF517_00595, partial [Planctomycetota bacterium]